MTELLLAHGLGGRSDLPVPLWLALYGGAAAVVVSFAALGAFWREPRLEGAAQGRPLPSRLSSIADSRTARTVLRGMGVLFWLITLVTAGFGASSEAFNPAPTFLYVWFWVGLVPASLLLGPIWKVMNPLRAISRLLSRFTAGDEGDEGDARYPSRLGYWPAAVGLAAFVWIELVHPDAADPKIVLGFVGIYSMVQLAGANIFGMRWYDRGDAFEVYSSLIASLSPLGRRDDGTIGLRNPFAGLAAVRPEPGLIAVVAVLLGSTAFDGLTRTRFWIDLSGSSTGVTYLLIGTAGLAASIGLIVATYRGAIAASEHLTRSRTGEHDLAGSFIHSLIPIALGYTIAHYFSLLVFQGQAGYILASDPFRTGVDLFGTRDWAIDYLAVSTSAIALVQVGAIVLGHIAGVVAAHDRALVRFRGRDRTTSQYPLLAIMVTYTVGGIALLVGT